jgi:hypothetical protein
MNEHIQEEQLILHYYGEAENPASGVDQHLSACSECRSQYQQLVRVLNSLEPEPIPERGPEYGASVWQKLPASVKRSRSKSWFAPRRWIPVIAMACLVVAAFVAGRYSLRQPASQVASTAGQVRERILLVAVGDHLERSQMVLVELANSQTNDKLNITAERDVAENLVEANRLYRQTAAAAGETGVANVLEDLERFLVEIAHSPDTITQQQLEEIQKRIEARGLLFKVRVVGSQIRDREAAPAVASSSTKL